jgi:hypothetical protein
MAVLRTCLHTCLFTTTNITKTFNGGRDSALGIVSAYGLDGGERFFSSPHHPDPSRGPPNLLIQWVPWAFPPRVRRLGRETYYSPPTSAEVKNAWIYTSTPSKAFMA